MRRATAAPSGPSEPSRRWKRLRPRTKRAIFDALEAVDRDCDRVGRLDADPIGAVRAHYRRAVDLEIAALVGACLAFGNVKALRAKVVDAFERLGEGLAATADDELEVFARLSGWKHRVYRDEDLARLVIGARRVQRRSGSLGARFARDLAREGALRPALAKWTAEIRAAGGLDIAARARRGAAHILPDPAKMSG
jgi:hypothetical protein